MPAGAQARLAQHQAAELLLGGLIYCHAGLDHDPIRLNRIMVQILWFEHDLFRKPDSTFRDHALTGRGKSRHRRVLIEVAQAMALELTIR
jgi:hypothetical protein